jgi:deoxyadenosine/deoxycytidine kinase
MEVNNKAKNIISVEGNIGVGKSTFTKLLLDNIESTEIVPEPVDMWFDVKNTDGKNILQTFYDDIPRWAYTFQNIAYVTRMIKIERTIRNSNCYNIFLDRSIDTDKHVFENMLWKQNKLQQIEHTAYNLWCDFYHEFVRSDTGKKIIYLRSTPIVCAERIKIRNREEEKNISLQYLEELHIAHEDWLINKSNVLILDCDKDFEHDINYKNELIEKVKQFIKN